jgi:hypothetical protein
MSALSFLTLAASFIQSPIGFTPFFSIPASSMQAP